MHRETERVLLNKRNYLSISLCTSAFRLTGALVRAGLSPVRSDNRLIGTVSASQVAQATQVVQFIAEPVVTARYVSVDLPGREKYLHMSEVMVEEFIDVQAVASNG